MRCLLFQCRVPSAGSAEKPRLCGSHLRPPHPSLFWPSSFDVGSCERHHSKRNSFSFRFYFTLFGARLWKWRSRNSEARVLSLCVRACVCMCVCVGVSRTCREYPTAAVERTSGVHFKWFNIIGLFLAQNIAGPGLILIDKYCLLIFH